MKYFKGFEHIRKITLLEKSFSFVAPPSPLTITHEMPDRGHIGMHTLGRHINR